MIAEHRKGCAKNLREKIKAYSLAEDVLGKRKGRLVRQSKLTALGYQTGTGKPSHKGAWIYDGLLGFTQKSMLNREGPVRYTVSQARN